MNLFLEIGTENQSVQMLKCMNLLPSLVITIFTSLYSEYFFTINCTS